jgi:hypothetical protein
MSEVVFSSSSLGQFPAALLRLLALLMAFALTIGSPSAGRSPEIFATARSLAQAEAASDARAWHVAPSGRPDNDGSVQRPLDLATALSNSSPARPGDTIWLHGGTYEGSFVSTLRGTENAPITVRQYPGERATLDGRASEDDVLTVKGAWTLYWGFEVTNSSPDRVLASPGSDPPGGRAPGLNIQGANTKFINLVVHDTAQGVGFWTPAENAELYGNLIYYNGWDAPDRGHGHAIYAQNRTGVKRIVDNIFFSQFSHGLHVYGSSNADLDNFHIEGNVAFNNGELAASGFTRNVLIGGGTVADHLTLDSNYTYFPRPEEGQNNLGYDAGCNDVVLRNNYFSGGSPLTLVKCAGVTMQSNTLYGRITDALMRDFPLNSYQTTRPAGTAVYVPIYNWDNRPEVSVDLAPMGLAAGTPYEIRNAQDYFGPPVASGTIANSPVTIPMTGLRAAMPVGDVPRRPAPTGPEFGVFIVLTSAPGAPKPPSAPTPPPTAPNPSTAPTPPRNVRVVP